MDEILIIMHRDSHFSGSFSAMLEYYENEGPGTIDEIDAEDIAHLKMLDEQGVPLTLGHEERRRVLDAKDAYKKVQALYESEETALLADLILSEEENLDGFSEKHLSWLIDLLHDVNFADPLFPGYGLAPLRAAKVLGSFKVDLATRALFERLLHIGEEEAYLQEEILASLGHARDFLLNRLKARPLSAENQAAAMALAAVPVDESLEQAAKEEHDRLVNEGCQDRQLLAYLETLYRI